MWSLRLCTNGITRTALPTSLPKGCAAGEQVFLLTPEMEETGGGRTPGSSPGGGGLARRTQLGWCSSRAVPCSQSVCGGEQDRVLRPQEAAPSSPPHAPQVGHDRCHPLPSCLFCRCIPGILRRSILGEQVGGSDQLTTQPGIGPRVRAEQPSPWPPTRPGLVLREATWPQPTPPRAACGAPVVEMNHWF